MRGYAPLWCKGNFSFLEGASHAEELVDTCSELGIESLALTDRDGVYGVVEAHVKARQAGLRLILGSQVSIDDGSSIVLLATNRRGYGNLCRLITVGRRRSAKGESRVGWREVGEHAGDLIALWGGDESLLAGEVDPFFVAHELREAFGDRLYAMAARHRRAEEPRSEARLRLRAQRYGLPVVAGHEVLYHRPSRRPLQDVLTCIRHRVKLIDAGRRIKPNAEHALKPPHVFRELFEDDPAAVDRTLEIADRCRFSLDRLRYVYPAERLPDGKDSTQWLRELTFDGARRRYGGQLSEPARRQLDRELALIEELDYGGYFLTMWEIVVMFARGRDILCQGRGAAANSAVCYCLEVTAVDPDRIDLLFERFVCRERNEPPDIDIDFEHERREEVIQHVYRRSTAAPTPRWCANFIRYRGRARRCARWARRWGCRRRTSIGCPRASTVALRRPAAGPRPRRLGLDPKHDRPTSHLLLRLTPAICSIFPRHLSIHPWVGFLLGHEPVDELVPIENASDARSHRDPVGQGLTSTIWGCSRSTCWGSGRCTQLHLARFDLLNRAIICGEPPGRWHTIPPDPDEATFDMDLRGPTPWACSRSRAGPKWRCCRG